ncbi:N-myc-interactor-like [Salvelinus alpinus]
MVAPCIVHKITFTFDFNLVTSRNLEVLLNKKENRFSTEIYAQIPEKKVKFTSKENEGSDDSGQCIKEKVAAQILKMAKCTVSCDKDKVYMKPKSLTLDPSVKFEVHLDVSTKTVNFSNVPPPPLPNA